MAMKKEFIMIDETNGNEVDDLFSNPYKKMSIKMQYYYIYATREWMYNITIHEKEKTYGKYNKKNKSR